MSVTMLQDVDTNQVPPFIMPVLIAVGNGGITEDAQIIEDQMQLFVQAAFPDNSQTWADQEAKDVLEAIEATEVLSSWEDPQAAPWPEHVTTEEEVPEVPQVTAPSEVETESEDSEDVIEASPSMEKDADADSAMVDVSPEDKELGASQGEPAAEFALAEQAEVFVEAVTAVSAEVSISSDERVEETSETEEEATTVKCEIPESEPAGSTEDKNEACETLFEKAAPEEGLTDISAPVVDSEVPCESPEPGEASSVPS